MTIDPTAFVLGFALTVLVSFLLGYMAGRFDKWVKLGCPTNFR